MTTHDILTTMLALAGFFLVALLLFIIYVIVFYRKVIYRIFEEKIPFMVATPAKPNKNGETVWLRTRDGRVIASSYYEHEAGSRRGVILFCHEYSANRWMFDTYVGHLRDQGFDVFTFDFCNHGESEQIPEYQPLQWVTQHEVSDVQAAIDYLKSRPDADPDGIGLFGVSKGGGAGIAAAAKDPYVRAVITDGAFPTHETVIQYMERWVKIFVGVKFIYPLMPRAFYWVLCQYAIFRVQRHHRVKYVNLERAIGHLNGRPLLMIHGGCDNYIHSDIVERFYAHADEPKELWIVPKAKHNCCLERAGDEYKNRVAEFFTGHLDSGEEPISAWPAELVPDGSGVVAEPTASRELDESRTPEAPHIASESEAETLLDFPSEPDPHEESQTVAPSTNTP